MVLIIFIIFLRFGVTFRRKQANKESQFKGIKFANPVWPVGLSLLLLTRIFDQEKLILHLSSLRVPTECISTALTVCSEAEFLRVDISEGLAHKLP